jgi:hypothetical protein
MRAEKQVLGFEGSALIFEVQPVVGMPVEFGGFTGEVVRLLPGKAMVRFGYRMPLWHRYSVRGVAEQLSFNTTERG